MKKVELKVLSDVYKEEIVVGEDGVPYMEEKVFKRNVVTTKMVKVEDIISVSELVSTRGTPYKTRCLVTTAEGPIVVKGAYNKIKSIMEEKVNVIGFRYGRKRK